MRASNAEMEHGLILANRAKVALSEIEGRIAETSRAAVAIVNGSEKMRAASKRAGTSIDGVSAIIEKNANSAAKAEMATAGARDTLTNVVAQSQSQSAAAGNVSNSLLSLAAQVQEMDATAHRVADQAAGLVEIVGHFHTAGVDDVASSGGGRRSRELPLPAGSTALVSAR
jgi:methyl-accepting chemotaxis protein